MKPDRLDLLHSTLVQLQPVADQTAERFYGLLFERDPKARALFDGVDMSLQRKKFMVTLAAAVRSFDHMEEIEDTFGDLGHSHGQQGVTDDQYDTVRDALMDALGESLGSGFDDEVRTVWSEAYDRVAAVMKGK